MEADPILTNLQYVMETGQELEILNFHKSFPITSKARVESVSSEKVTFVVQPPGSVCLENQEQTILLSRGLSEAVRARINEFDLVTGKLVLSDFNYVSSHFGDRSIARVQPEGQVQVNIELGNQKYIGNLADVSLNGVGIIVSQSNFQKGQLIQVTLPLPEGEINLPGKILSLNEVDNQTRLSVGFTRNAQEIALIMHYIKDRRTEILADIEAMYQDAYQQKTVQTDMGKN
jgi:hypothetical protein